MRNLAETRCLVLAHLLLGIAGASVAAPAEEGGPAKVTFVFGGLMGDREQTRLVAPGEWIPYTCSLATPYRGGTTLRFDLKDRDYLVSIDGGPKQPPWIRMGEKDGPEALKRELDRGSRGFAVLCPPKKLADLPLLPRGREIALTVQGRVTDWAPLERQTGIAALALPVGDQAGLEHLAAFPDLTSLRLFGLEGVTDLGPLARLPKVTWLQISGLAGQADLSPLAEMPSLRGLRITSCAKLSDLGPLAKATGLEMLKIESCRAVADIALLAKLPRLRVLHLRLMGKLDLAPLAAMTQLVELGLYGSGDALDITPLRPLVRRGLDVRVSDKLKSQLDKLREADF